MINVALNASRVVIIKKLVMPTSSFLRNILFLRGHHLHHRRFLARAIKMPLHFGNEFDHAVLAGKEGIICGADDVDARSVLGAALADDDLADHDLLAVLKLDAEAFGDGIAS